MKNIIFASVITLLFSGCLATKNGKPVPPKHGDLDLTPVEIRFKENKDEDWVSREVADMLVAPAILEFPKPKVVTKTESCECEDCKCEDCKCKDCDKEERRSSSV